MADHVLHLSQIHDYVEELCVKIENDMNTMLDNQFHIPPDTFIHDDPRCCRGDWGFLDHPQNPWVQQTTLLEYILTTPALRDKYAYINGDGDIVWNPAPCHQLAKAMFDNLMHLCVATILTCGGLARGTELLSHLIRNIAGGSIRNVFALFNELILRGSYNKTAGATSSDKTMARVPYPPIGRLLIRHLAFIRPMFCELQLIFRPRMVDNATHFLFAGLGRPLDTRDLSVKLSRAFKAMGHSPGTSYGEVRQMVSFIIECNHIIFRDEARSSAPAQMGHTEIMHLEHYAGDMRFPIGMNDNLFIATAIVSAKFQLVVGFPPTLLHSILAGRERQWRILQIVEAIQRGRYIAPGQEVIQGQTGIVASPAAGRAAVPALTIPGISHALTQDFMPSISRHINLAVSQAVAAFANIAFPHHPSPLPRDGPTVTRPPPIALLVQLRQMLPLMGENRPNRGFTDAAQAQVTHLMWQGGVNIAYISRTSESSVFISTSPTHATFADGGKGMPGLLNARMEVGRLSTVWIVPLMSMHEQLALRCENVGMTVGAWTHAMSISNMPTNIIVALETTSFDTLQAFLRRLTDSNLLARIIIDEAHLLVAHQHFRDVMLTLDWVGKLGVPVIIQSATIPPSVLPHLFQMLGVTQYQVCRERTSRSNISYRVVKVAVPERELERLVQHTMAGHGKMLVFCTSQESVKRLAAQFHISPCTGSTSPVDLNALLQDLRQGIIRVVISTPVLGVALDVPEVDTVVHLGCPFSMVGYIQEAGRGGRGPGTMSTSIVLLPERPLPHKVPATDYMGVRLVFDHVLNTTLCRQWMPSLFNDGIGMTCTMMGTVANLCDVCERNSRLPNVQEVEYSDAMILPYLVRQ